MKRNRLARLAVATLAALAASCSLDPLVKQCDDSRQLESCGLACDQGRGDLRSCLRLADAYRAGSTGGTTDDASRLYGVLCDAGHPAGCLGAIELLEEALDKVPTDSSEARELSQSRQRLLERSCQLLPGSETAREFALRRLTGTVARSEMSPTMEACLNLARTWLGVDREKARRAFERACIQNSSPDGCRTQMDEIRKVADLLLAHCDLESPARSTECSQLASLLDPLRCRQLGGKGCDARAARQGFPSVDALREPIKSP